jgi:hypothetical protein
MRLTLIRSRVNVKRQSTPRLARVAILHYLSGEPQERSTIPLTFSVDLLRRLDP